MAKTFAEYAREREATMSPAQRDLMRAFDHAAAFGQVIYGARKARNLRQTDPAGLSGVTQADISRIERGQVAPTTQTLLKLTDALGVEIQFRISATRMRPGFDDGVPPNVVQRVMGHERATTTLDLYTRRTDDAARIMQALDDTP